MVLVKHMYLVMIDTVQVLLTVLHTALIVSLILHLLHILLCSDVLVALCLVLHIASSTCCHSFPITSSL